MARKKDEQRELTPFVRARMAMESGDSRSARKLATEAAQSGPEGEREDARQLLAKLEPDVVPMLVAGGVLILIIIACWLAILRLR